MKTIEAKFAELEAKGFDCSISYKEGAFYMVLFPKTQTRTYTHSSFALIHSDNEYPEGFPTVEGALNWALEVIK